MKPLSGVYLGSVFIHGSRKAHLISVRLDVDANGPVTGSFEILDPDGWSGPRAGKFHEGGWSPYGALHLEEEEDAGNKGDGFFDGSFAGTDVGSAVIWGRVFVTKDRGGKKTVTQTGTLLLSYSVDKKFVNGEGPWGS